jgi:copper(I)-binding protein
VASSPARTPPVIRGAVRRSLARACAAVALLGVVGCGSNFDAQTQQPYQPAVGISDRSGQVYSINTLIVTDGQGNGTVVAALINQSDAEDTLQSVTAVDDQGGGMSVQPLPEGGISLPARNLVQLATDGSVRLESDNLEAGRFVTLTFTFANAAPVKVDVPVVEQTSTYADVPVGGSA